ncbi:MAG: hypothetical protein RL173_21 [Fibrobacterota bacterium]|jgi:hypothetical protein
MSKKSVYLGLSLYLVVNVIMTLLVDPGLNKSVGWGKVSDGVMMSEYSDSKKCPTGDVRFFKSINAWVFPFCIVSYSDTYCESKMHRNNIKKGLALGSWNVVIFDLIYVFS